MFLVSVTHTNPITYLLHLLVITSMWLENSLLRKTQNNFEFFIQTRYTKLDNLLYYGSENKTELPVTQPDPSLDANGVNNNYITQFDSNENGSELSSFSHVDAPNDTIYMICGVVIAMLLVGIIIILVAVTINKLRKRDESSATAATAVTIEAQQQQHGHQSRSNSSDNNHYHETHDQQISTAMSDGNDNKSTNSSMELETITFARSSGCNRSNVWVFPPKAPSPNISNCVNHDAMITTGERNGFKGFKKQFSGRFKRLVSTKKDATSPIPPELKPQLKTIYVY